MHSFIDTLIKQEEIDAKQITTKHFLSILKTNLKKSENQNSFLF